MVENSTESLTGGEKSQLGDLALANRILSLKEILDGFGHVSARSVDRPHRYLLSRSMAPSLIREEDIRLFDLESMCTTDPNVSPYLERFIHGEIYRARPDVQAIVHAHTHSVLPFGLVPTVPLRPVSHMAGFIGDHLPIFDIRRVDEGSDMLIRNAQLGVALAQELGDSTAVLMRGHGVTVVGESIKQAVYRAFYLDVNARIQSAAQGMGQPIYLNAAEAAAAARSNDTCMDRPWKLWEREIMAIQRAEAAAH